MAWDAIVIGAGHNGLVAAATLARAKLRVLVLERRPVIGGATVTEEIIPGYRFSRLSYVNSLFRPEIARELRLDRHGLELLPRNPSSFTPLPDGRSLLLGPDPALNAREIAKFSARDADAFPRYEAALERLARFVEPLLDEPPVDPASRRLRDRLEALRLLARTRRLGPDLYRLVRMIAAPANALLDEWFESEPLKATLATDAIIGAMASPSTPGTAYVLFHHVMGETQGARGVWAYIRGGMGSLASALASAARELGVEIRTESPVARILTDGDRVTGVATMKGDEHRAPLVLSSADPHVTFLKLVEPSVLPEDFRSRIESLDFTSAVFKLNVALDGVPEFRAAPGKEAGPWLRGTIHIAPDRDYIERAYDDARRGRPSEQPVLECTIPSVIDDSLAPPGKHVLGMFVQYAPNRLAEGTWDDAKAPFVERCLGVLEEYAPGVRSRIVGIDALSPLDLEREFSLTGGNIFHGAMTLDQLAFLRPAPGWSRYRTPVFGLLLCGAGAHPGGGVIGAAGRNAAREALRLRARRR